MKIKILNRALSLLEGPTNGVKTRAKSQQYDRLNLTADRTRDWKVLHGYRNIYLVGGYVAEGIDLYPLYAIGNGYELESKDEKAKLEIQEFLKRINFYDITWQLMIDAEVVKDGIGEIVLGEGKLDTTPVNVVVRPAECFDIITDSSGKITEYRQVRDFQGNALTTPIPLTPDMAVHYQYMSRPDSPYGISIMERIIHDVNRDTQVSEAITNGIILHGTPKWHININGNRPDAPALTDAEWNEIDREFKDFNSKDQFQTEGDISLDPKDTAGVQNVQQYSDVTMIRVISGMGVPGELLGLRQGTTDATAVTRTAAFFRKVKSCQRDIEQVWNRVIDRVAGKPGLVKLKLNDVDPEDFEQQATAIATLRQGPNPNEVVPWQYARKRLKIPVDEYPPTTPEPLANPLQSGEDNLIDQLNKSAYALEAATRAMAEK
jgi:hypothetical protein